MPSPSKAHVGKLQQELQLNTQTLIQAIVHEALAEPLSASEARAAAAEARADAAETLATELKARVDSLEAKTTRLEEQCAKRPAARWPAMPPALIALIDRLNAPSAHDEAVLSDLVALGAEVQNLKDTINHQAATITAVEGEVAELADFVCTDVEEAGDEAADESGGGGASVGHAAVPLGWAEEGRAAATTEAGPPAAASGRASPEAEADGPSEADAAGQRENFSSPRIMPRPSRLVCRASKIAQLEAELSKSRAELKEVSGKKLDDIGARISDEVRVLVRNAAEAKAAHETDLAELRGSTEERFAEVRAAATEQQGTVTGHEGQLVRHSEAIASKASQFEADALGDALRELRGTMIAGAPFGSRQDTIEAVQSQVQSQSGQLLSLQTQLRSLLRKAEADRGSAAPVVDMPFIEQMKEELHGALAEIQAQLHRIGTRKADADVVEAAIDRKADLSMLQHKADRKFCEALLSRFSIEVGRQLGDLEQNQTSIKESLQKAITGLMRDASDAVVTREPPKEAEGGAAVAAAAAPAHAPPPSVYMPPTAPIPERPQTAPSSGGFVVHSVTTDASSHSRRGMPRRPGSASEDRGSRDLPPMGKGQLPLTVFTTGDAMPAGLDQPRYAFQPRRHAGGGLTPGENRLVRVRPQSAAAQSSKGRLGGSRSAAGLLSSQTSQAAPMRA